MTFGTAGLLFPAISLLMLAYGNRFLGLASVARLLVVRYREAPEPSVLLQMENLRVRLLLLRHTQATGVLSLLFCTGSVFALMFGQEGWSRLTFCVALLLMLLSLALSLREIYLSVQALNIELDNAIAERP